MKFILKWLLRLFILGIVLLVIFLLSLDSILRVMIEHNIRAQTGMDAEIGKFHLGLVSSTVTIKDFRLFNPPSFGGTPFLNIPEIHVEYDRVALTRHQIHVTLMRFNLGELDIVKNEAGRTNIFSLGLTVPSKKSSGKGVVNFKKQTGYDFKGIDALNVSIGKAKFIDLKDQRNNHEQNIDIENCVIPNVKSEKDLTILTGFIAIKSGDFFSSMVGQKSSSLDILKLLGY